MKELDSKLVRDNGHWERHTWLPGAREDLGEVINGWSGTETLVRRMVIKPVTVFQVKEHEDTWDDDVDGFQYNGGAKVK